MVAKLFPIALCIGMFVAWCGCGGGGSGAPSGDAGGNAAGGGGSFADASCSGSGCVCADAGPGLSSCSGECVSLASDVANCGGCGRACSTGQRCESGRCVCPSGDLACDGRCVDASTSNQHCGACGHACSATQLCQSGQCILNTTGCIPPCGGGQSCNNGSCECATGQSFCGEQCVDTQNDAQNCGGCDSLCGAKQSCVSGVCACDDSSATACGARCIDLQTDAQNCGECGHSCSPNQACAAGSCQSVWKDGCLDTPAHEVQLRELAVYQTIKVSIFDQSGPIDPLSRTADIVSSRRALFRAFVDLGASYKTKELSAHLTISNGTTVDRYVAKQRISAASSDSDPKSTFQLTVPASKINETTSYSLEVVECSAGSGDSYGTRFPATGETLLGTRTTGGLSVTFIPVRANGRVPDMSDSALAVYRAYLESMYPISSLDLQVGKTINTDYPLNWNTLVEQIRKQREADEPAPEVYYYGVVQPTEKLSDYCRGGCTAGIGYVNPPKQPDTRAAVGLGYKDEVSASTLAHELGHNHGRKHSLCPAGISGADPDSKDAKTNVWAYDWRKSTFLDPATTLDVMGYCDPKWISMTTYQALVDRIADVNAVPGIDPSDTRPLEQFRVLILEQEGPRWSVPYDKPIAPYGTPELANVLDIDGKAIAQVIVYRTQLPETDASTILVPEPEEGWNYIEITGAMPLAFAAPVTVPMPQ